MLLLIGAYQESKALHFTEYLHIEYAAYIFWSYLVKYRSCICIFHHLPVKQSKWIKEIWSVTQTYFKQFEKYMQTIVFLINSVESMLSGFDWAVLSC